MCSDRHGTALLAHPARSLPRKRGPVGCLDPPRAAALRDQRPPRGGACSARTPVAQPPGRQGLAVSTPRAGAHRRDVNVPVTHDAHPLPAYERRPPGPTARPTDHDRGSAPGVGRGAVEVGGGGPLDWAPATSTARVYRLSRSTGERGRRRPGRWILKDHPAPTEGAAGAGSLDPRALRLLEAGGGGLPVWAVGSAPLRAHCARCYAVEERPGRRTPVAGRTWRRREALSGQSSGSGRPPATWASSMGPTPRRTIPGLRALAPGFPGGLALMSRSTLDRIDEETWQHPLRGWPSWEGGTRPAPAPRGLETPEPVQAYPTPVAPACGGCGRRERLLDQLARSPGADARGRQAQQPVLPPHARY